MEHGVAFILVPNNNSYYSVIVVLIRKQPEQIIIFAIEFTPMSVCFASTWPLVSINKPLNYHWLSYTMFSFVSRLGKTIVAWIGLILLFVRAMVGFCGQLWKKFTKIERQLYLEIPPSPPLTINNNRQQARQWEQELIMLLVSWIIMRVSSIRLGIIMCDLMCFLAQWC